MSNQAVKSVVRNVKPILSTSETEAKRRVLALYKLWYREIPAGVIHYALPQPASYFRAMLREEIMKHKNVKDVRVIDMLVIKGHQELQEFVKRWKQTSHVMYRTQDTTIPKPNTFLGKFLAGSD